ncbi:MAG TPA: roadblock/LC7 domain-containing protein [Actinomycetota bacterium]|nr:roadblock/LC7 domain-containing protein [Actinomycetota bacterium]
MSKAEQLAAALDDFLAVSTEVEAAAIVSADGLPMASALPPHVEEDRLAAMSAALLTLGERAATGLGKGELAQVFVEGVSGYVVLMSAGHNAVLVAVTDKGAKVGLVLFEMRRIAARVAAVMDGDASHVEDRSEPTPVANVIEESVAPPAAATLVQETPIEGFAAPEPAPTFEPEPVATEWDAVPTSEPTVNTWEPAAQPAPVAEEQPAVTLETASSVSEWDVPPAPTSDWDAQPASEVANDGAEERATTSDWETPPSSSEEAESPVSGWQ